MPAVTVCSQTFTALGRSQARALGFAGLPIATVPHPFGNRTRAEIRDIAAACVEEIAALLCGSDAAQPPATTEEATPAPEALLELPADAEAFNALCMEQGWGDGLPLVAPTPERVARMLEHSARRRDESIAAVAPAYRSATVEKIAVNAVMAGCRPEYLPLLIAAVEAMAQPQFNLQSIQATTNPVAVWLVVNGPAAGRLAINSGSGCFGPGAWANATLGRALRLILQNIGGAAPGGMDRATFGQPAKYTLCCAENEAANPWQPLQVERGHAAQASTVTVAAPLAIVNMHTHTRDPEDLLRVMADTMTYPTGADYVVGGAPWIVLSPEHAEVFRRAGLSKSDVKRRLWEQSKMQASRLAIPDFARTQNVRRAELGEFDRDAMLPISPRPEDITIIVAGGPGTHSLYVPTGNNSRSVTREVLFK